MQIRCKHRCLLWEWQQSPRNVTVVHGEVEESAKSHLDPPATTHLSSSIDITQYMQWHNFLHVELFSSHQITLLIFQEHFRTIKDAGRGKEWWWQVIIWPQSPYTGHSMNHWHSSGLTWNRLKNNQTNEKWRDEKSVSWLLQQNDCSGKSKVTHSRCQV